MQFRLVLFLLSLLTVMLLGGLGPRPAWVSTGRVEAKLHQATERH